MSARLSLLIALVAAVLSGVVVPAARAATSCDQVGAPSGSDRNPGTVAAPKRTAQGVIESLSPGETGCLRSGVYADEVNGPYVANFHRGGRPGARITLRSFPGERARLQGVVVVSRGADYVTLSGLDIDGRRLRGTDHPIGIQVMARRTTIRGNDITDPSASCLSLGFQGWGAATAPVVTGNRFHDCGTPGSGMFEHAIYSQLTTRGRIAGNVIERAAGYGVHLYGRNVGMRVTQNVITANGGGIIIAGSSDGVSSRVTVAENAIADSRVAGLQTYWEGRRGQGNRAVDNCLSDDWVDFSNGGVLSAGNVETTGGISSRACRPLMAKAGLSRLLAGMAS